MKWLELIGFKAGNRTIIMSVIAAGLAFLIGMSDGWDPVLVEVLERAFIVVIALVPVFLRKAIISLKS